MWQVRSYIYNKINMNTQFIFIGFHTELIYQLKGTDHAIPVSYIEIHA